jgi:hypothetical protein
VLGRNNELQGNFEIRENGGGGSSRNSASVYCLFSRELWGKGIARCVCEVLAHTLIAARLCSYSTVVVTGIRSETNPLGDKHAFFFSYFLFRMFKCLSSEIKLR